MPVGIPLNDIDFIVSSVECIPDSRSRKKMGYRKFNVAIEYKNDAAKTKLLPALATNHGPWNRHPRKRA